MDLSGKVALVTGGSRGIGRATALALARAGADVVVNYVRNHEAAREVVQSIQALGKRAVAVQANVGVPAEVEALFAKADEAFGPLSILVNNAGTGTLKPLAEVTVQFWNETLQLDLTAPFLCTQAAARRMAPRKYGRIVNVSALGALTGIALDGPYTAAKAGLIGFTKSTARHLGSHNITVNSVCPGPIYTDLGLGLPEEMLAGAAARSALGRVGTPEDVADTILFFASDYSRHVTGQTLLVDGGIQMP
jgi:3-oxoacyl-[acyl-carrier protein] reductase